MSRLMPFAFALLPILVTIPAGAGEPAYPPVGNFQLDRYLGTWYEIARLDHSFERGMDNVTANYFMRPDGKVRVLNKGVKSGEHKEAEGKAKFACNSTTGHLKVSFFWIFYGDYIIVDLDPDYQWVLITGNSTKYLWILSRSPKLPDDVRERLVAKAKSLGFDTDKLIWVKQD